MLPLPPSPTECKLTTTDASSTACGESADIFDDSTVKFMQYPSGDRDSATWSEICNFHDGDDPNDFVQYGSDANPNHRRRNCGYCANIERLSYEDAYDVAVGSGHQFCVGGDFDTPFPSDREYEQSCVRFTARSAEI